MSRLDRALFLVGAPLIAAGFPFLDCHPSAHHAAQISFGPPPTYTPTVTLDYCAAAPPLTS